MYQRVTEVMKQITSNYELVYVNDASPDNAMEILRELAAKDKRLTVFSHSRNFSLFFLTTVSIVPRLKI